MARPRTENKAVCQNKNCLYFRKEKGKDITKQGKNYAYHQRFLCKHCSIVFVETKGTPLYQKKLSERKIKNICKELVRKNGVRSVAERVHVNKNTVCSYLDILAQHALVLTNHLVHNLGLSTYEVDELLTFIKKTKKHLTPTMIASLTQAKQQLQHV
jgi:transposase-like protein